MRYWTGTALLCLALLTACAGRVEYLRGDSQAIPIRRGDVADYPPEWSGAWLLSDAALLDLLDAAACQ